MTAPGPAGGWAGRLWRWAVTVVLVAAGHDGGRWVPVVTRAVVAVA